MIPIVAYYAVVSILAYVIYAIDKKAAIKNRRRVSEKSLHLLGVLGGWPGALLAQQRLRHKTQKTSFQLKYWLTVTLNLAGLWWISSFLGIV
ncbi:hypothetical protein LCGC14_0053390 [marine sediment metagenome]|uniref:Cold-shock DNA-binding domain protein n=1 Tax=marine sediment metagenome TaxID=412755 RepID=A0A0F9W552_9ZZZZ|nr:DUF1294 domain-containing protein [Halomonas sp.]HDZ45959.1 DUF1294 domain-containing protein [Halomonas sp.]HEB03196.1 DUF1294 domain-containing protein [Halomonas sp.]